MLDCEQEVKIDTEVATVEEKDPDVKVGDVFAAVSYVLSIIYALDQGPVLVEQFSRLIDIRRRVDRSLEDEGQ